MAEPTNRDFFESLNKDLAKGLEKALETGFAKGTMKLSHITADQIGRAVGKQVGTALENQKGGGGGGQGSAGKGGAAAWMAKAAKGIFKAASNVVAGNALHIRQFGDSLARTAVATQRASILSSRNISFEFGQWHQDLADVGKTMAASLGANVKSADRSTQKLLARSLGLGTSMGTLSNFMATATNVIGLSTSETHSLGTEIQNLGLTNNMLANSVFQASTQFAVASKGFQLLDSSHMKGLMQLVGGLEAKETGVNVGGLVARILDLDPTKQIKLMTAMQIGGGGGTQQELANDPQRFIAKAIIAISKAASRAEGKNPMLAGLLINQLKDLGLSVDMQFAAKRLGKDRGFEDILRLGQPGAVTPDQELQQQIQGSSEKAFIAMKDFAIEINGLTIHQGFLSTASQATELALYKFKDGLWGATEAAKKLGAAAGGKAILDTANAATGGVASDAALALLGITALAANKVRKGGVNALKQAVRPPPLNPAAMLKSGKLPDDFKTKSPWSKKQILVRGDAFKRLMASSNEKLVQQTLVNLTKSMKDVGINVGTTAYSKVLKSLKVGLPAAAIVLSVLDFNERVKNQTHLRAGVGVGGALVGGTAGAIGGALATKAAMLAASKALALTPIPGARVVAVGTLIGAGIAAWFASDATEAAALQVHDWLIPPETEEEKRKSELEKLEEKGEKEEEARVQSRIEENTERSAKALENAFGGAKPLGTGGGRVGPNGTAIGVDDVGK